VLLVVHGLIKLLLLLWGVLRLLPQRRLLELLLRGLLPLW